MIATALLCRQRVLIADEPTTALYVRSGPDPGLMAELRASRHGDPADHARPRRGRGHLRPACS